MAKFSGSTTQPGQVSQVEQQIIADAPVNQLQQQVPQAPETLDSLLEAEPTPAATPEDVTAGVEAGLAAQDQVSRERIPTLHERAADTITVHQWTPKQAQREASTPRVDGGLKSRAAGLVGIFGGASPQVRIGLTPTSPESREAAKAGQPATVADLEAERQTGSLIAGLNRSGAVESVQDQATGTWTNTIDPVMLQVGSAVTENMLSESAFGETAQDVEAIDPNVPAPTVSKAQNNVQLGKDIHREYSRLKNAAEGRPTDDYQDLSREEAATLGDAFKEMWAIANPTLITRATDKDQVYYQLTPEGVEAMKKGAIDRKRLFPKQNVRPAKTPTRTGQLPGEQGRTVVKRTTGKVKQPLVGARVLEEATRNLNEVPNVVDRRREAILYATILPVLKGDLDWTSWQAEINNMGEGKMRKFQAAEAAYLRDAETGTRSQPYSADEELASLQNVIAQEVRSIAQERGSANHLTYVIQSFNGRMSPQQTYFDPTSSKAVRFVTRNAVPAKATPGSRVDMNLRQMYAMMLIKGADAMLPERRLEAYDKNAAKLEEWGNRLEEVLKGSMSQSELDAIADAISNGVPLTDPNFPPVRGLQLDPQRDAELIKAIKDKGEDGPHFIDGLIDVANYEAARREGRPHLSYFNAYVDGKTNGIASNGIQMGSEQVARATGVIRNNTDRLLDAGDIRDQLKDDLLTRLDESGFDGALQDAAPELYDVAREVYGLRDLNKATTMTFGYGKELASFKSDINDTVDYLNEVLKDNPNSTFAQSLAALDADPKWGRDKLVETLHQFYVGSLTSALSNEAIQSRALMRSAAMLHALTNQLFSITGPTGFQLNMGGEASLGFDQDTATTYSFNKDGVRTKVTAGQYTTESTAAAIRTETDETGTVRQTPGEDAYGGSVPAPVQSLDAATVAMSASGKSWDKMKAASNGNPYMHTIYDAFKLDAMGFDVGVAEINKNWLDASMNWSYLEETYDATKNNMTEWHRQMDQRNQGELVDITMAGPYRMMGWLLEPQETSSGRRFPTRLGNKLRNLVGGETEAQVENKSKEAVQRILEKVRAAGLDPYNLPDQVTVRQLRLFVNAMAAELELSKRLPAMINKTNANKKRLKKVIDAQKRLHGNEVLQYYAH